MPIVKTLSDRVEKFKAKTAPDRVATRYGAVAELAQKRYLEGVAGLRSLVDLAKKILESEGVPPGQEGVYFAFVLKAASKAQKHVGATLQRFIEGLKARFVGLGADPAILDKLAKLIIS